ncbi:MAG: hypothetical protein JNL34_14990, partial [Anaerolineae bacterium]|nr:hypothetical protein [Anaerolineae bacterium]
MSAISRRAFLQALGISAAATAAPWTVFHAPGMGTAAEGSYPLWGRALETVPITDGWGSTVRVLLPDAVTPITPLDAAMVRLPGGYAARRAFQPVARLAEWAAPTVPGWVQVAAPYAALRAWCAPDAPLAARPGWGGVLYAADGLMVDGMEWLGLGSGENAMIGWSPAAAWTPAGTAVQHGSSVLLVVEREERRIRVLRDGTALWEADAALPAELPAGEYALAGRNPVDLNAQTGAPWALDFGAWRTYGAYWH